MKELIFEASTALRTWECSAKIVKKDSLGILARVNACGSSFLVGVICYFSHSVIGNEYFLMLPDYRTGCLIRNDFDSNLEIIREIESNLIDSTTIARAAEELKKVFEF